MSDHRGAQTPVRNQGDRPTCVGFAISAAHEWIVGDSITLSPEDAMWAAHQAGGSQIEPATSVRLGLTGLTDSDHARESAWPYGKPPWPAERPAAAGLAANQRVLPGWRELTDLTVEGIESELDRWLPVILTIRVVLGAWRPQDGQIDAEPGGISRGNHAVMVVGVDSNTPGQPRILVKNSWGVRWGDVGYGYISRRYLDEHAIRAHVLDG